MKNSLFYEEFDGYFGKLDIRVQLENAIGTPGASVWEGSTSQLFGHRRSSKNGTNGDGFSLFTSTEDGSCCKYVALYLKSLNEKALADVNTKLGNSSHLVYSINMVHVDGQCIYDVVVVCPLSREVNPEEYKLLSLMLDAKLGLRAHSASRNPGFCFKLPEGINSNGDQFVHFGSGSFVDVSVWLPDLDRANDETNAAAKLMTMITVLEGSLKTDLGNAERLIEVADGNALFIHGMNSWIFWTGDRWRFENGGRINRLAAVTLESLLSFARRIENEEERNRLVKHAINSQSAARIKAMIELARSNERVDRKVDDLDCNLWLLNCPNGTLDLKSGRLMPHRRGDLITKVVPVSYDPDATCEHWMRFLSKIMGRDETMVRYLQRAVG